MLSTIIKISRPGISKKSVLFYQQIMESSFSMKFFGTGYSKKLAFDEVHEEKPDGKITTMVSGPGTCIFMMNFGHLAVVIIKWHCICCTKVYVQFSGRLILNSSAFR